MAAFDLAIGNVEDVTDDAADRGTDDVQDAQWLVLILIRAIDQNQRSPTNTVSPGP